MEAGITEFIDVGALTAFVALVFYGLKVTIPNTMKPVVAVLGSLEESNKNVVESNNDVKTVLGRLTLAIILHDDRMHGVPPTTESYDASILDKIIDT